MFKSKLIIFSLLLYLNFSINNAKALEYGLVTNEKSNSVSVIDLLSLEVIKELDVGPRPRGIGLAPDKSEIYIAVSGENKIKVIDPESFEIVRSFYSGEDPESFAVHPNGYIFISNEEIAQASVINPSNGKMLAKIDVGIEPEGVSISPNGETIVVTSESSNMAHFISNVDYQITKNIVVGARPRASCFSQKGKYVFVTSEISGEVSKLLVSNGAIVGKTILENDMAKPKDILLSKDGKTLYVAGGRSNMIYLIDINTMAVTDTIKVGRRVWGLALSYSGEYLLTTDGLDHQVSVIDTTKHVVKKTIKVGQFPWGVVTYRP